MCFRYVGVNVVVNSIPRVLDPVAALVTAYAVIVD